MTEKFIDRTVAAQASDFNDKVEREKANPPKGYKFFCQCMTLNYGDDYATILIFERM